MSQEIEDVGTVSNTLQDLVRDLYNEYGQRKPMGASAPHTRLPHFFLLRTFLNENDLLIILNTKRCKYQCHFCQLPAKSSKAFIPSDDILAQFEYVVKETKHALSILDRLTLSNEGSVLDHATLPMEAMLTMAGAIRELRRVRTLVLETRLEFVKTTVLEELRARLAPVKICILTGFETVDPEIRDKVLFKRESLDAFLQGLDRVAEARAELGAYVLFKPSPAMTDEEALMEADRTIDYLVRNCRERYIPLTIRLNPMYLAKGSVWARSAQSNPNYLPPRLTDIMRLAEEKVRQGVSVYIGLSTEGLVDGGGTYLSREDYSPRLIRSIKLFNDLKINSFDWDELGI